MASISSWLWGASQIDDAVDKATSELMPAGSEDIALNLEICDQIRSKSAPAKDSMRAIKRRLNHKNPNVQLLALSLTDTCVKNGGDHFLVEVASREFMDNLVSILKMPGLNIDVKNAILRVVQNWSVAFEGKPSLTYVGTVYSNLTKEGFNFPPKDMSVANSAMVDTQTAPEWIDSEVCMRCRDAFSFTNRKHHCRNCGLVFDNKCSSKAIPLPHFGITQDVRVCESCYSKVHKSSQKNDKRHRSSNSLHTPRHRGAQELADAELQRAIQLSLQEVNGNHSGYTPSQPPAWQYSEPPLIDRSSHPARPVDEEDPDLKAAIEASLRESQAPKASAPVSVETPRTEQPGFSYSGAGYSQSYPPSTVQQSAPIPKVPTYDLEPLESDVIMTFSQTVEQVHGQGGRDISRYPAVNELYDKASSLRPKLAMSLDDAGRKEQMLTDMHEKMSQIVKLYDNLLTEQVSHPQWRSQPVSSASHAPYQQQWAHTTPVPPQDPYVQHAPAHESNTPRPQQQQQQYYTPTAVHPVAQQFSAMSLQPPLSPSLSTYNAATQAAYAPSLPMSPPIASPPPVSIPQYNSPNISVPQRTSSLNYGTQSPSASVSRSGTLSSSQSPIPPSQNRQLTYQQPQKQYQQQAPQPQQSQLQAYQQQYLSPPPPPQAQQLPPPQHYQPPQQQQYSQPPPPQIHQQPQQQQYSQPPPPQHPPARQQYQPPVQQSTMPQFPVAPTSAPQAFDMYGPSIPSMPPPQEERKEALLIDL